MASSFLNTKEKLGQLLGIARVYLEITGSSCDARTSLSLSCFLPPFFFISRFPPISVFPFPLPLLSSPIFLSNTYIINSSFPALSWLHPSHSKHTVALLHPSHSGTHGSFLLRHTASKLRPPEVCFSATVHR